MPVTAPSRGTIVGQDRRSLDVTFVDVNARLAVSAVTRVARTRSTSGTRTDAGFRGGVRWLEIVCAMCVGAALDRACDTVSANVAYSCRDTSQMSALKNTGVFHVYS
jgi:hypothetical protein